MTEFEYIDDSKEIYDVLIVGSGVTGGWAAKEFCEKGLKTLLIERGRSVEHQKDYHTEGKAPWQFTHRTEVENLLVEEQYSVQSKCYAFSDATKHFFGNDKDLPYTTETGTNFDWIRANQLGGKSILWHRQTYRFSDYDFNANKADGHGIDWPVRLKDLNQWYQYVERHIGVSGSQENLPQLPDSEFQPPFELNTAEQYIKNQLAKTYPERPMIIGRCAHLTQPTQHQINQGRMKCMARSECHRGCSLGAYFSSQSSTLPDAAATGNLHIATNSVVHSLIYDQTTNKVKGVKVIDNNNLSSREYFAKVVFLCASTLASTQIMLNSKSKRFPNGIANSSGVLGHYLMDHNYNAGAGGKLEGFDHDFYSGRRPTSPYIPNFRYEPKKYGKGFIRGYAFSGKAYRQGWKELSANPGIGVDYKNAMLTPGEWRFSMYAQGEMLPRYENEITLHPTKTDKWGIPLIHVNCKWSDNERLMMADAAEQAEKMLKAIGLKDVQSWIADDNPGLVIHEVGTARMGNDPKISVLNKYNQCHDIDNLFVTDGSAFCSSAVVNPSLTFMAFTVRAVDYCVKEMNAKRI